MLLSQCEKQYTNPSVALSASNTDPALLHYEQRQTLAHIFNKSFQQEGGSPL